MKQLALMLCAVFVLSACETTKAVDGASIEVRPVTQISERAKPQKIDINAQLAKAESLQVTADFIGSYGAYKTLLYRMDADHAKYKQVLLGLADSALALSWRDAKYAGQARQIYNRFSDDDEASQPQKHYAEAGLLLLDLSDCPQETAEQHLRLALENNPDDPRLWNALGRLHDQNSDWLNALDAYIKALSVAQSNGQNPAAAFNNMGMSLLMQSRIKGARAKFKQALKAKPDMAVYANNLRLAQILSGQTNIALKGLEDTKIAQIYNDAGVIAQAQGDHAKAARLYKKAIDKSPIYFKLAEKNLAGLAQTAHVDAISDEVRSLPLVQAPALSDASAYGTGLSRS